MPNLNALEIFEDLYVLDARTFENYFTDLFKKLLGAEDTRITKLLGCNCGANWMIERALSRAFLHGVDPTSDDAVRLRVASFVSRLIGHYEYAQQSKWCTLASTLDLHNEYKAKAIKDLRAAFQLTN